MIRPISFEQKCSKNLGVVNFSMKILTIDEMTEYIKSCDLNNEYVIREITPFNNTNGTIKFGIYEKYFNTYQDYMFEKILEIIEKQRFSGYIL